MSRILLAVLILGSLPAFAIDAEGRLEDPVLQARYEQLTWELRCLVCQNQNIADSNADLAKDLRGQVKEMLLAGRTDKEILTFMTDRYGDFVLYRPRFTGKNLLLWGAPGILLVLGIFVLARVVRQQSRLAREDGDTGSTPGGDTA